MSFVTFTAWIGKETPLYIRADSVIAAVRAKGADGLTDVFLAGGRVLLVRESASQVMQRVMSALGRSDAND